MTTALPADPYHALGLTKDATAAAIKTAYRKLVLKHHPDKVQDESQKQSAADLFHKVQAAWETIGDEEKRAKYDALCKLTALRREVAADRGPPAGYRPDVRQQAAYRSPDMRSYAPPPRSASFRTEEIRPIGPDADYFEKARPRDYEQFDRPGGTPPRERGERRSKPIRQESRESERAGRREKTRLSTKATNRDRDYKYAQAEIDSASDSDHYAERSRRSPRELDDERRERERYFAQARRQQEDAASGRFNDERTQKLFMDAQNYIGEQRNAATRRYDAPRRPSPPRSTSTRDHPDYVMKDGRPVAFRRGSGRPRTSSARDDADVQPRRRREADRSSSEYDEVPRRPVPLATAKSAPHDIRIPLSYDKPRASSVQHTREEMADFVPSPVKRADSMPQQLGRSKPVRQSTLRQTQTPGDDDYESPRRSAQTYPAPGSRPRKEYADEYEYATPDGYVTEPREPSRRTRSPEPIREKVRTSSTRYPAQAAPVIPPPLNTRTTSYTISPQGNAETLPSRPKLSRGNSDRKDSYLYGEVQSPRDRSDRETYTVPAPDSVKYREIRPDNIKMQSGYSTSRRPSEARVPGAYRGNSFNATPPLSA